MTTGPAPWNGVIGAVRYLNSKPLIEGLPRLLPQARLLLDVPSRLADLLAVREIDIGLIPVVECLRSEDYRMVSNACVATRGAVLSVKLFSRVPLHQMETLALDEGSRTSAVLLQILLAERYGVHPRTISLPLGSSPEEITADAFLLIGDRAIHGPAEEFAAVWDLGAEWTRFSGLPFVFAVWAARKEVDVSEVVPLLEKARDAGVQQLSAIAHREAPRLGISETTAYDYLSQNLHFRLGAEERAGVERFRQLATKHALLSGEKSFVCGNQGHSAESC